MRNDFLDNRVLEPFDVYKFYVKNVQDYQEKRLTYIQFIEKYDRDRTTATITYFSQDTMEEVEYTTKINNIKHSLVEEMGWVFDIDLFCPKAEKKRFFKITEYDEL